MTKRILGLDLGTNSIGWALIESNFKKGEGKILGMGSRIIPMSQDVMSDFGKGNTISQTAERTFYRGARRLRERHLLRRERLHRVLNVLNFLPEHYANEIDFEKRLGQFKPETEPKLAYNNEFIFKESFQEMLTDFSKTKSDLLKDDKLVPYDWTIYYLRNKALSNKISKQELAWIILNFNQKRGYYQLRGEEEEENPNKLVEFYSLKVVDVTIDDEEKNKRNPWYSVHLENGWIYRRKSNRSLDDWIGKNKDFIVTTDINDDGTFRKTKDGEVRRSFRSPKEDDWTLVKKKTEQEIEQSNKTVGVYIYETLLSNPNQKIRGQLVRTIERKYYKDELKQILKKQIELQPELFTTEKFNECVRELYRSNKAHQTQLINNGSFIQLFLNDIIFYQRPLRSQKSNIGNCSLEYRERRVFKFDEKGRVLKDSSGKSLFDKDENGEYVKIRVPLKAIPKSNPYYQEFRIWQWLHNLRILRNEDDYDVTNQFIQTETDYENLFDFLMKQKEVDNNSILKYFLEPIVKTKFPQAKARALREELNNEMLKYRWNYVFDSDSNESKSYPMNETAYEINRRLNNVEDLPNDFLTREIEQHLWHIIYSVTDKIEFEKALNKFAERYQLDSESFVESFKNIKPYDSEYGRFSEKAIKKLLPLFRLGKYWSWNEIDEETQNRIEKIITGEYDENIKNRVREKAINLTKEENFQGLQLWLAQYIVYDRHSESEFLEKWNSVEDLKQYLKDFKQHSLRNPIVEQVITETLRVVGDIWQHYGKGQKDYFNEIHIELGRDMKNTREVRTRLSRMISENENTNLRIKAILEELVNDIEEVRPYSPIQQELFKIYEEGVLNSGVEIEDDILDISKKANPTKPEIERYKLWLEQKYKSPYTGKPISLSKLFTPAYQIEHVIPQSRFFDDSLSNKVICESEVNSLKSNLLGFEFINEFHGQKVTTSLGEVEILSVDAYTNFVNEHYANNRVKRTKLLMDEIPEVMIERQLNDTRYISKFVSNLLSNIVRSEQNDEGINSKNLIPLNGKITNRLKQDWGLNAVWNDLILPRFERMNELTNSNDYTSWNKNHQKYLPAVPLEYSKGFQRKRIDHRHHALDALIIACATRDHVNLLNNRHANSKNERYDLQYKLRHTGTWTDVNGKERTKLEDFKKPWDNFTLDAKNELKQIVISFKKNIRVINKATNYYEKLIDGRKIKVKQKGVNWAIRKPMHKETVSGKINLPWVKVSKDRILTATRNSIDTTFKTSKIKSITDTGIQKILINHLSNYDEPKLKVEGKNIFEIISKREELIKNKKIKENPDIAFSAEGIEDMNNNIVQLNDGKFHQLIYKVRTFEMGNKFQVGYTGNKKDKYVEAAKGTNLFFAIYWDENRERRVYETIPLNIVIERQKQGLISVPETDEKGNTLLFYLSPNDLVYVPEENENFDINNYNPDKVYKMVSASTYQCFFTLSNVATSIVNKQEFSSLNKMERAIDGTMIKEVCIKLKTDRLGNISKV